MTDWLQLSSHWCWLTLHRSPLINTKANQTLLDEFSIFLSLKFELT
jgi:hypothetical protein